MKIIKAIAFLSAAMSLFTTGAQVTTTTKTTLVKNVTTTVVESVSVARQENAVKKIAVFVQNRTRVTGMDDEIDGIRDRLCAAFAEIDGFSVVDSSQVVDTFRKYKVTTAEEKSGMLSGIFSGGSVPAIAKAVGCDYIAAATVVNASSMKRNMGGRINTVFSLRMTLKIMDSTGTSVDGMPTWVRQLPILDAIDEPMNYYQMLFDQWATDVTGVIAQKAHRWRPPAAVPAAMAVFHVSTTVDKVIAELESQTKGAKGEQLQELRRVVGGATIELDGAVIGSAPGSFRVSPGLHQLRVTRAWMKPYFATVNIQNGVSLEVALEMSDEGIAKWGTVEALRADVAKRYAEAALDRGVRINIDTSGWRDVGNSGVRVMRDN